MKLYVGNVDFKATEDHLGELFAKYGDVDSVKIITDKFTGRSKGFAFIEMNNDEEAKKALESLNGYELNNRGLNVTEARPKEDNYSKGGSSNNRGGGYNNRY